MHRHSNAEGHLYQGQFKSFPIQQDEHPLKAMRYVEANPLGACLAERAELCPFSNLWAGDRPPESRVQLEKGLVTRPADWIECVNQAVSTDELERLHVSVNRGRPFLPSRYHVPRLLGVRRPHGSGAGSPTQASHRAAVYVPNAEDRTVDEWSLT
jgi:hypothetical protein